MKSTSVISFFTLCLIVLFSSFYMGCDNKITNIPVIESLTISPDTVAVNDTAMIQISVNYADQENLVYYYTTNGGSISGIGDTVAWKAPSKAGVYLTKILVADSEGNQANDSVRLVVVKNDSSSQITGVAAFLSGTYLDLADAKVRLFTSKENWENEIVFAQVKVGGFGPIVSFDFDNVPVGTYYLDIWKDSDFGNTYNPGDYYGWFGKGTIQSPNPESFVVVAGTIKVLHAQMWVVPVE